MQKKGENVQTAAQQNKKLILEIIKKHGGISRKEMANSTGLNPSTVTNIINDFLDRKLVYETGTIINGQPGRNSVSLKIEPNAASCVVVAVGVEKTKIGKGFFDNSVEILAEYDTDGDFDKFMKNTASHAMEYFKDEKSVFSFSIPGLTDRARKKIYNAPHLGWKNASVPESLKKFPCFEKSTVYIANEAKLSLKAEMVENELIKNKSNGIYLFLSEGIGGAVLIDGKLYLGTDSTAGEIGHISINADGPICSCGRRGCLETYVGIDILTYQCEKNGIKLNGKDTQGKFIDMLEKYQNGNKKCMDIFGNMIDHLTTALSNLINTLNPEFIVFGGMGKHLPASFMNELKEKIMLTVLFPTAENLIMEKSNMDLYESRMKGATILAMEGYISETFG